MRNTFVFAAIISLVCSLLLALTATLLRPRQMYNVEIDQKKNILIALGFMGSDQKMKSQEIETLYSGKVKEPYFVQFLIKEGESTSGKLTEFMIENSEILVEGNSTAYDSVRVSGSQSDKILKEYLEFEFSVLTSGTVLTF